MKIAVLTVVSVLAAAGPAAAETWQAFSRSEGIVYMADIDSIAADGEVTSILLARAPRTGEAVDYSYQTEVHQFRCAADEWRSTTVIDYGPDGAEISSYGDETPWEPLRPRTIAAYLEAIACDGARAQGVTWPTIRAFIDGGRP